MEEGDIREPTILWAYRLKIPEKLVELYIFECDDVKVISGDWNYYVVPGTAVDLYLDLYNFVTTVRLATKGPDVLNSAQVFRMDDEFRKEWRHIMGRMDMANSSSDHQYRVMQEVLRVYDTIKNKLA